VQLGVVAGLPEVDADDLFLFPVLFLLVLFLFVFVFFLLVLSVFLALFFLVMAMGARRDAILGLQAAHREAEKAALAEVIAETAGQGVGVSVRVGDETVGILEFFFLVFLFLFLVFAAQQFLLPFQRRLVDGEARNIQLFELAGGAAQVKDERTVTALQAKHAAVRVRRVVVAVLQGPFEAVDGRPGNAVVHHVDYAADGTAAVKQGGRTAQYLDTVSQQGIHRHSVVGTQTRHVGTGGAVLQGDGARPLLAANDRATDAGAEGRIGDTRLVAQSLAEGSGGPPPQLFAGQQADGQRRLGGLFVDGHGNQHVFQALVLRDNGTAGRGQQQKEKTFHFYLQINLKEYRYRPVN